MVCGELAVQLRGMTPGQAVHVLESDVGLAIKDLQVILDTTPKNINRWITEQAYPQHEARRRLAALMALIAISAKPSRAWKARATGCAARVATCPV